jgi:PhnB protein
MKLMNIPFKPDGYNSLSPYLIVNGAQQLVDLLKIIFEGKELRKFMKPDGKIMHAELLIDDSIVMIADGTSEYAVNTSMLHLYVPDVFKTFQLAINNGCTIVEKPVNKEGDPDIRGSFMDFAGNYWAVGTQGKVSEHV